MLAAPLGRKPKAEQTWEVHSVDFWGIKGQRVSRAGPSPSQSSGWSLSPAKVARGMAKISVWLSAPWKATHPPAQSRAISMCWRVWLWGRDVGLGQVRPCSCPNHCPTAQPPCLGLRPKQLLQDTNSQATPRTGMNFYSPAMLAPHKALLTQNTAETLKMLHS